MHENKILSGILDWIYPPRCVACDVRFAINEPTRHVCAECKMLFEEIAAPTCKKCGRSLDVPANACAGCANMKYNFTHNKSRFLYESTMRDLLLKMKFSEKKHVAEGLGALWVWAIRQQGRECAFDTSAIYVPLPMHPKKQRERGFNQANIFAAHLGRAFGLDVRKALVRKLDTPPQAGLGVYARRENVDGAFAISKKHFVENAAYVIVDDIFTTGASVDECAGVLLAGGAASVSAITLAITGNFAD